MKVSFIPTILGALLSLSQTLAVNVGDAFPSVELHHNFPPDKVNIADRIANKNVVIVGLPGAFTPT
jgi:peroxiredoxin